jgi:hypothetical protein
MYRSKGTDTDLARRIPEVWALGLKLQFQNQMVKKHVHLAHRFQPIWTWEEGKAWRMDLVGQMDAISAHTQFLVAVTVQLFVTDNLSS